MLRKISGTVRIVRKVFYIEYTYIDDPYISFSDDNLEAEEVLDAFSDTNPEEIKITKLILLLNNGKVIVYDDPIYTFSLFSEAKERKKTAEFFLKALDNVL